MNLNTLKLKFSAKKNKAIIFVALALVGVLLSSAILPSVVQAANPQFNIFTPYVHTQTYNHDYYLLDVKNDTKGTDWNFPVSADAGDTLTFYVYYHNGSNYTTANNTTLRVVLPSGQNISQTVTGYLWADNATNATASNPLSQSVQVNLSSSQSLQYISGSAKWFPNQVDWRTASPTPFPNGQNDSQLFSSGINIGSVQGCWEFSGAIVFKAKAGNYNPPVNTYDLSIQKTVRNITSGQSSYSESVNANNNDRVAYQVQVQNTGNTTLNNVMVRDVLPFYLSYVSGTSRMDGNTLSDGIISGGVNIGSISQGATRNITFEATINNNSSGSSQTLTNYAYARADQVSEKSDTALINLGQSGQGNLNISKTVRNITTGTALQESINANSGDRVLFLVQVSTPSNSSSINNVRVWDTLPAGLTYVSGSTRIDNSYTSDGIVSGGINLGTMSANQSKSINFEATVNSSGYIGQQTLTNYAYASADNIGQVSDFAQVITGTSPAPTPSNLTKKVVNLTWSNGSDLDNQARVGNTLKYTLSYTNNTNLTLNNVQIFDVLPSYTSYLSVDNNGSYSTSGNMITWNVGTLSPNASITVSYQVKVLNVPDDFYVIENTALLRASNINDVVSNITRTTVEISKTSVKAVTGANTRNGQIALSIMFSLMILLAAYLMIEYPEFWRGWRLKLTVAKLRFKGIE